jgi:hypothetical protein
MELPKVYGITEGAFFLRLDPTQCFALIPYRNKLRIPYMAPP